LLILSAAFCLEGGPKLLAGRPSLWKALGCGLGLGMLNGVLMPWLGSVLAMPFGPASLFFYVAFFVAGVAGKRNGWLTDPLSGSESMAVKALVPLIVAATFAVCAWLYVAHHEDFNTAPVHPLNATHARLNPPGLEYGLPLGGGINGLPHFPEEGSKIIYGLVIGAISGLVCMLLFYATLELFRTKMNFEGSKSAFFAGGAYTVYLIHPWVVVPLTFAYGKALGSAGMAVFPPPSVDPTSEAFAHLQAFGFTSIAQVGDGWIWLGWCVVSILSNLILWPLAHGLRKLPGLRNIL